MVFATKQIAKFHAMKTAQAMSRAAMAERLKKPEEYAAEAAPEERKTVSVHVDDMDAALRAEVERVGGGDTVAGRALIREALELDRQRHLEAEQKPPGRGHKRMYNPRRQGVKEMLRNLERMK